MVIVSEGRSIVTFDIQKEICLPSASAPSLGASEALPPFPGTLTLPPVASQPSDEVLVGRSVVREGSSCTRETSATSTLLGLVNENKEAMGYRNDTKLATALADAASSGEEEAVLKGHEDTVRGVACFVGADGKPRIVSTSGDKTVRVWNPSSGEEEAVLGMNVFVLAVCVSE